MIKETKFFQKQAEKAERMACATADEEASQNLTNLALAYRSQAEALKRSMRLKKQTAKKGRTEGKSEVRGWKRVGNLKVQLHHRRSNFVCNTNITERPRPVELGLKAKK